MKGGSDPSQNIQIMKWGSDLSESFVSEGRRSPLVVLGSTTISFRSVASKGFPSGYSKSACVRVSACSACPQKTPTLRGGFRKRRLTNTPRRHRLADGQLSPLYAPPTTFQLVWGRLCDDVLLRLSCLFERTLCATRGSEWS